MATNYEHLDLDEKAQQLHKKVRCLQCTIVLLICALVAVVIGFLATSSSSNNSQPSCSTNDTATANTSSNYFWGITYITSNSNTSVSDESLEILQDFDKHGYSNYEYNEEMIKEARFKIGSNTKLFVSAAIYQLQEKGLLNVTDSINDYLNHTDFIKFGYSNITKWCPIVYNDTTNTCQNITFENLLAMSSGIVESLNCEYGENSIFQKYCFDTCDEYEYYKGSLSYYINTFINAPLMFTPGTEYAYSNPNFILAGYLIEKISNLKFEQYLEKYITNPMKLNNTYYDPWTNKFNIKKYETNEYVLYYNSSDTSNNFDDTIAFGSCSPELNNGFMNTAGGMMSTISDMHHWYHQLFNTYNAKPNIFTSVNTQKLILKGRIQVNSAYPNVYYAQGVVVAYNTDINTSEPLPEYPEVIYYEGGTLCSHTSIAMYRNFSGQDITVTAFSNTPHAYFTGNNRIKTINDFIYHNNESESYCQLALSGTMMSFDDGNAQNMCFKLFEKTTGVSPLSP